MEPTSRIDHPDFKPVAWFDAFNAHVYFDRDEAQRAFDAGNTVLPIESVGRKANLLDKVVADALTGKRGVGAMRVSVERIDPESMFTDKPADTIPTSFFAYVVNTLNEVTGSNEWQKEFDPVELGQAARDAIKALAVKPKDAGAVPMPVMEVLDRRAVTPLCDHVVMGYTEAQLIAYGDAREAAGRAHAAPVCTCPSGDGSLRHPCPQHPPAEPAARAQVTTHVETRDPLCSCMFWPDKPCPINCEANSAEIFTRPSPAYAGAGDAEEFTSDAREWRLKARGELERAVARYDDCLSQPGKNTAAAELVGIARRLAGGDHANW